MIGYASTLTRRVFRTKLSRKAGSSLLIQCMGVTLNFLSKVVLARILGAQTFGDYMYVIVWTDTLSTIGKVGFDVASLRYVAAYQGQKDWGLLKGFLRRSFQVTVGASMLPILGLVIAATALASTGTIERQLALLFWLAAPNVVILALIDTQRAILRGFGKIVRSLTPQAMLYPSLMMVVVGLYGGVLGFRVTAATTVLITAATGIILIALQSVLIRRTTPPELTETPPQFRTREWLDAAVQMGLTSGAGLVLRQADILIVGAMLGTKAAGIYTISTRMANLTRFGLNAVNTASAPIFARLHAEQRMDELQKEVFQAARFSFFATFPVVAVTLIGAEFFLRMFGDEFTAGVTVFQVILVGELIWLLTGSNGLLMNMSGHHKDMTKIVAGTAIFELSLLFFFVQWWGMLGAAVVSVLGIIVRNTLVLARLWQGLKINPTVFSRRAWSLREG